MVPEGWVSGRVSDLLDGLESGVSVNGEDRALDGNEKGVLKVSAVSYGYFNPSAVKAIDDRDLSRAKTNPKQDQVAISRSNTEKFVGASAYIDSEHPNLFLPDKLWQTISKENSDMKWLSYVLASSPARYTLSRLATGTSGSMKNINKGELLSLKILIPSSLEQKKIALILATWDQAITTTEQLLANSQQQKKALMQQLLTGKKRLLDENGKRFSGEWTEVAIQDIGKVVTGSTPPKADAENYGGDVSWATAEDFVGKYVSDTNIKLSKRGANKARLLPKGSVLVTCIASIGKNAIANENLATNQQINSIVVNGDHSYEFVYYQVTFNKNKLLRLAGTTAVPIVSKRSFEKLKLDMPRQDEQGKIALVLSTLDKKNWSIEKQIKLLRQEKKALMQQLLTGKRRVKVDEEAA